MPSKLKKKKEQKCRNDDRREREGLLPSSKVVGDDCWREKNSKGFKKRLEICLLSLLMIRGRIILKREGMIRSGQRKNNQIRILT